MDLLAVRTLPFLTRRNYYYELLHLIPWSVYAGLVEGQFASVVVAKSFGGSEFLIAVASATPVASLLFSLVWGMLSVGRPKIRLLTFFCLGTLLFGGTIGAVPPSETGAIWFIAQISAAQVLLSGVVTLRSAVWKSNYPKSVRGRITARLQRLRRFVTVPTVLLGAYVCDIDAESYRYVYPIGALVGLIGVLIVQRVRIRGERHELHHRPSDDTDGDLARDIAEPFSLSALLSPGNVIGQMVDVLRADRAFRRYCVAQSLTGIANLMTVSVMAALITRELDLSDYGAFWVSTVLIVALPNLAMLGSIGRWGRMFDSLGVLRMRVANVVCWTGSLGFALVGALVVTESGVIGATHLPVAVGLFAARALLQGVGMGGGQIAWNLGHLHFAEPRRAELYMGVHVSLTGVRGLIAPLVGIWLWHVVGWFVWVIAIVLALMSLFLYAGMAQEEADAR